MKTAWLTYAWEDNKDNDVDYVAQQLEAIGMGIILDKWTIGAGKRLWEQIAGFIVDPGQCDAWILYATQNSLGSERCKEELAYALDRALDKRGLAFPVIGLFPSSIDHQLIPPAIRTRLFVSTTDPDWQERVKAAVEGRGPSINRPNVQPYALRVHEDPNLTPKKHAIEVRPRAGTWSPFVVGIPVGEKDNVKPSILRGTAGQIPGAGVLHMTGEGPSTDGRFWLCYAGDEATPSQSYFVFVESLPSQLVFGALNTATVYVVRRIAGTNNYESIQ